MFFPFKASPEHHPPVRGGHHPVQGVPGDGVRRRGRAVHICARERQADGGSGQAHFRWKNPLKIEKNYFFCILAQIVSAVAHLHSKNICHRDIKGHFWGKIGQKCQNWPKLSKNGQKIASETKISVQPKMCSFLIRDGSSSATSASAANSTSMPV